MFELVPWQWMDIRLWYSGPPYKTVKTLFCWLFKLKYDQNHHNFHNSSKVLCLVLVLSLGGVEAWVS